MKKFPWFLSFELGARQACDRRHRTMGTVHSGKISHLTWTFTKKYWAVLGCTGLYWAVLGHLRYLLGNVQVKWRILPLCTVVTMTRILILDAGGCRILDHGAAIGHNIVDTIATRPAPNIALGHLSP